MFALKVLYFSILTFSISKETVVMGISDGKTVTAREWTTRPTVRTEPTRAFRMSYLFEVNHTLGKPNRGGELGADG